MTLSEELTKLSSVFFDTAPIIYYVEAHPQFGPLNFIFYRYTNTDRGG